MADYVRLVLALDCVLPEWDWWSDRVADSYAVEWAVYLCQICGVPFDYLYCWANSVRAPYCSALAGDLEPLSASAIGRIRRMEKLSNLAKKKLQFAQYLISQGPRTRAVSTSQWLGLVVSVHYLTHFVYRNDPDLPQPLMRRAMVEEDLLARGHRFDEDDFQTAWSALSKCGLVANPVRPCDTADEAAPGLMVPEAAAPV